MYFRYLKTISFFSIFTMLTLFSRGSDTLRLSFSFNYFYDLSDSYNGGNQLSGEFSASKSWYGIRVSYDQFQSLFETDWPVYVEDINKSFSIPYSEQSIMQSGGFSFFIKPINQKWVSVDLFLGVFYGRNQCLSLREINFNYNLIEDRFNYIYRDYILRKSNHFGYQVGLDITFKITKIIGLQVKSKIINASNSGSFFFIGSGLLFNIK